MSKTNAVIKNITALKKLANKEGGVEVAILLSGGVMSVKTITYDSPRWYVMNHIDDTEMSLTTKELETKTNIIKAMKSNSLVRI